MVVPLPVPGLMELIHEGAPVTLHEVQLVVTVKDVEPAGELTVILAGDTFRVGGAPLCVMITICVRPHPLIVNIAVRD